MLLALSHVNEKFKIELVTLFREKSNNEFTETELAYCKDLGLIILEIYIFDI
jgi:hypothetical protein